MQELNDKQRQAVETTEGYVRVIAGAGSGKTRMLVNRYLYIVKELGISTKNVVCLTFSNKAVNEMKRRIKALLGEQSDLSFITTFHGLGAMIVRESTEKIFYTKSFQIIDRSDQKDILATIYDDMELKLNNSSFEKIIDKIEIYKSDLEYIKYVVDPNTSGAELPVSSIMEEVIRRYISYQKKHCLVDFSDLINFALYLLRTDEGIRKYWQEKINYVLVDEYQDTTGDEIELVDLISGYHKNVMVVGDPDQNIYEWRGSKMSYLVEYDKTHVPTTTIVLDENYRSTPNILKCANELISHNKYRYPKELFTNKENGEDVKFYAAKNDFDEAKWVANMITKLKEEENIDYSDISILYRASYLSRKLETKLTERKIPYELIGNVKFYQRMEIKDMIAYMKICVFDDDHALLRIINTPPRQFGKMKIEKLKNYQTPDTSLYQTLLSHQTEFKNEAIDKFIALIEKIRNSPNLNALDIFECLLTESGYEKYIKERGDMERFSNLIEFRNAIQELLGDDKSISLDECLNYIALQNDFEEADGEKVKLMTIHASKGLEFQNVFLMGLNEDIFPSKKTIQEREEEGLEEERRLCYVAITRAEKHLFLSSSTSFIHDSGVKNPSRFLEEIGYDNYENLNGKKLRPKYKKGDGVEHKIFGVGEIIDVDLENEVYKVKFKKSNNPKNFDFKYEFLDDEIIEVEEVIPDNFETVSQNDIIKENDDFLIEYKNEEIVTDIDIINEETEENLFTIDEKNETTDVFFEGTKEEIEAKITNEIIGKNPSFPMTGWRCIGISDLGYPCATCQVCAHEDIRYLHYMKHEDVSSIVAVGCVCAGKMEGSIESAESREKDFKNRIMRKRNFLKKKWKVSKKGNLFIRYRGKSITIYKVSPLEYRIYLENKLINAHFANLKEALERAFDEVDN